MYQRYWFLLCMITVSYCKAVVVIQASTLDCNAPTELNESAIIELDIPLVIPGNMSDTPCELLVAGAGFGPGNTITFVPTNANTITLTSETIINGVGMLQVQEAAVWDIRSFTQETQRFIFQDIHIILQPGGSILAGGATFQLKGSSKIITQPISIPS